MIEPYITEKQCKTCGECKPLTMFSPTSRGAGGRQPYCKKCRSERQGRRNKMIRKTARYKSPNRVEIWPRPSVELALDVELRFWPATPCAALGLRP